MSSRRRGATRLTPDEKALQEMLTSIYEARKTVPRCPFIGAALHWCYKAKVLYRTMDELHLLRDWQCVRYIEGLATVSKQLTNWFKYEKRREQKDEPPNGNT